MDQGAAGRHHGRQDQRVPGQPDGDVRPRGLTDPAALLSAVGARRRLATLRLSAQRIGGLERSTPLDTVRWMLALQGQDLPGAKWSIGLRAAGGTQRGVEAAFDAGEIVRSWPMRGTLHVVAGQDLRWMLALTTPAAIASSAQRRAVLGLELADAERAREAVE